MAPRSEMERLGEYLTRMREEKGVSLEDLSSKTRISIEYLKALEDNDFAKIPIEVFAKGFLRVYARTLYLDEKEILARFGESSREYYEKKSGTEWLRENKEAQAEKEAKKKNLIIGLVTGGFFLALILLIIFHNAGNRQADQDVGRGIEDVIIPPSSKPVSESGPGITEEMVSEENLVEKSPAEKYSGEMVLEIDATEVTWVSARIDDSIVKEALLKPGDKVIWKASDKLFLTLGNAGGVNIKWNGKLLEPLGPKGGVVRDFLLSRG